MRTNHQTAFLGMAALLSLSIVSCAQNPKVKSKTITIINGDTTITEGNLDDKELAEIEKNMTVIINNDGDSKHEKKIVKKIIINDEDMKEGDSKAMAYAYSIGEDAEDMEVTTDQKDGETRITIRKKADGADGKEEIHTEKKIVKKSVTLDNGKKDKQSMNLNINVKNTTAKIELVSGSKSPLNVSILDENGKQVFYDTQKDGSKYSKEIPLGKKGTYFLNLIQDKKSTSEKLVVE